MSHRIGSHQSLEKSSSRPRPGGARAPDELRSQAAMAGGRTHLYQGRRALRARVAQSSASSQRRGGSRCALRNRFHHIPYGARRCRGRLVLSLRRGARSGHREPQAVGRTSLGHPGMKLPFPRHNPARPHSESVGAATISHCWRRSEVAPLVRSGSLPLRAQLSV